MIADARCELVVTSCHSGVGASLPDGAASLVDLGLQCGERPIVRNVLAQEAEETRCSPEKPVVGLWVSGQERGNARHTERC